MFVIDLYCGLGGWTEGFLAEGFTVYGFDIEKHEYGDAKYPAQLIIQDVLTLDGRQFKDAAAIVASPPCTEPSYRAMPWKRAKALNAIGPPHKFIELFNACFRIQREACEAAGRHIPMVVENVRGAEPWVGRAAWHFGSYYLWGDVPALMPIVRARKLAGFRSDGSGKSFQSEAVKQSGVKNAGTTWRANGCNSDNRMTPTKVPGLDWSKFGTPDYKPKGFNVTAAQNYREGIKVGGAWFGNYAEQKAAGTISPGRLYHSDSRKAASAAIAKIPFPLARHIAQCVKAVS
jgi:C-5 cytosine-specific DNA methylase